MSGWNKGEFCQPGGPHLTVLIRERPWRRLFRRTYVLRCFECALEVRP